MFYKPMVRVVRDGVIDKDVMQRDVKDIAAATAHNLSRLDKKYKRATNSCEYHAEIEQSLYKKQTEMVLSQIFTTYKIIKEVIK